MGKIKVKVEKTTKGFSAYAVRYSAFTTGTNVKVLIANMVKSLNLYFEEEGKGKVVTPNDISFELKMTSVFEVLPIINMKALAARLEMNHTLLSQYANGRKKASPKQTRKILGGINEMGRELAGLNLIS